jgi:nitroimidazol reductase NimA-like FMN-containing flavoprotein (pyridoxamine 5'-phosphate oxidase superfamily)
VSDGDGVPDRVERLIADAPLSAHLATAVDDRPHVAPVWYVYEDGRLLVVTGGRKLENLRANPRVAVSIERADGPAVDWQVTLLGTARVVDDPDRRRSVADRLDATYRDGGATAADGGDGAGALVEIRIGSASASVY